jgi:hypothetical protein
VRLFGEINVGAGIARVLDTDLGSDALNYTVRFAGFFHFDRSSSFIMLTGSGRIRPILV